MDKQAKITEIEIVALFYQIITLNFQGYQIEMRKEKLHYIKNLIQKIEQDKARQKLQKFKMLDCLCILELSCNDCESQKSNCQQNYMTKTGTNILMTMVKNPLSSFKSAIINHISNPVIKAEHRIFNILMIKSQVFNYIILQVQNNIQIFYIKNHFMNSEQDNIKGFFIEEQQKWLGQLQEKGAVIIKNVLSKQQVEKAKDMFWEWLESLGSGIKRQSPQTWKNKNWPGNSSIGFFCSYGGCHTHTSWFIRTHPKVKKAFSTIWSTQSLITSFDTIISWRPWWNEFAQFSWQPYVQNLHIDQNPSFKKGFHCVQGMVPLIDVSKDGVGGLQVVPGTNNDKVQEQLSKRYPFVTYNQSDWVQLNHVDPYLTKGRLIQCQAGSLILFDSRTIHGGKILYPSPQFKLQNINRLVRLAVTVTMVPKQLQSKQIQKKRFEAFKNRIGLTHWPQYFNKNGMGSMAQNIKKQNISYKWPQLTPQIQDLI